MLPGDQGPAEVDGRTPDVLAAEGIGQDEPAQSIGGEPVAQRRLEAAHGADGAQGVVGVAQRAPVQGTEVLRQQGCHRGHPLAGEPSLGDAGGHRGEAATEAAGAAGVAQLLRESSTGDEPP